MKIAAIIQARLSSERLPAKSLYKFGSTTVIEQVFERVARSELIDDVILTTPDAYLVRLARKCGVIACHYTGPRDVLREYFLAARSNGVDVIVRITGDCVLMDPEEIDRVIDEHIDAEVDYTVNRNDDQDGSVGDGLDVEVFNFDALARADKEAKDPADREHVTRYFRKGGFKVKKLKARPWKGRSLNTWEDYEYLCNFEKEGAAI